MDDRHDHQHDTDEGDPARTGLPPVLPDPADVDVHTPLDAGTGPDESQLDPARADDENDEDDEQRFDAG